MKKEFLLDKEIWEKSFVTDANAYLTARAERVRSVVGESSWNREGIKKRILASMNFVHSFFSKEINSKLEFDLELKFVKLEAKRVPVRLMTDPDLVGTGEIWVFIEINLTTIDSIVDDILKESCKQKDIERFTVDWCQSLEGSMIQELAHVLYIHTVCSGDKRDLFIESMSEYPSTNEDVDNASRDSYLVSEIERHGRTVQVDFLRKVYPNSWALAWCDEDIDKIMELNA